MSNTSLVDIAWTKARLSRFRRRSATTSFSVGDGDARRSSLPSRLNYQRSLSLSLLPENYWGTGIPVWKARKILNASRKYLVDNRFELCTSPESKLRLVFKAIWTGVHTTAIQSDVVEVWTDVARAAKLEREEHAEDKAQEASKRCPEVLLKEFKALLNELEGLKHISPMQADIASMVERTHVMLMSLEALRAKATAHREGHKALRVQFNGQLNSMSKLLETTSRELSSVYTVLKKQVEEDCSCSKLKGLAIQIAPILDTLGSLSKDTTFMKAIDEDEFDKNSHRKVDTCSSIVGRKTQELNEDACMVTSPFEESHEQELDEDVFKLSSVVEDVVLPAAKSQRQELDDDACKFTSIFGDGEFEKQIEQGDDEQDEQFRLYNDEFLSGSEILPDNTRVSSKERNGATSTTSFINKSGELHQSIGQSEQVNLGSTCGPLGVDVESNRGRVRDVPESKDLEEFFTVAKPSQPKPRYSRSYEHREQYSRDYLVELENELLECMVRHDSCTEDPLDVVQKKKKKQSASEGVTIEDLSPRFSERLSEPGCASALNPPHFLERFSEPSYASATMTNMSTPTKSRRKTNDRITEWRLPVLVGRRKPQSKFLQIRYF